MGCINCGKKECSEIADGLVLCKDCEAKEKFHLVKSVETGKMYWKNVDWVVVDEEIMRT